jgi:ABC-2 type transport system ATP-binding protein
MDTAYQFVIEVVDAAKRYRSLDALRGVSFSLRTGQQLALLGPNGAGKTTLIRAICGRVRLDGGSIHVCGQSNQNPEAIQKIGFIPQELAVYSDLTARENLQAFGRLHGLRGKELLSRIDWALEWIGLTDRQHSLVKTFSGGMKRRVNIACGVLHGPRVLLLDEPTVGVDPQSRQRIYQMVDQLQVEGTSVLLTTHQLEEAESRSDRIIIMDRGKILADGSMKNLIERTDSGLHAVKLDIHGALRSLPNGVSWDQHSKRYQASINDIDRELPDLLRQIRIAGGKVMDIDVRAPNLHDVFLQLTGSTLRE